MPYRSGLKAIQDPQGKSKGHWLSPSIFRLKPQTLHPVAWRVFLLATLLPLGKLHLSRGKTTYKERQLRRRRAAELLESWDRQYSATFSSSRTIVAKKSWKNNLNFWRRIRMYLDAEIPPVLVLAASCPCIALRTIHVVASTGVI